MPDEIDDRIAKLVERATVSAAQREANAAAAATLERAASREREELEDKWHADQVVLADLAQMASRSAAAPFVAFAYRSEVAAEGSLGHGHFVADCTDGSQAILRLDVLATGRVAFDFGDDEPAREVPLLTANEESYATLIVAFLAMAQAAKRDA